MILTFENDLDSVKLNQLGQRSPSSRVTVQLQTDCCT